MVMDNFIKEIGASPLLITIIVLPSKSLAQKGKRQNLIYCEFSNGRYKKVYADSPGDRKIHLP